MHDHTHMFNLILVGYLFISLLISIVSPHSAFDFFLDADWKNKRKYESMTKIGVVLIKATYPIRFAFFGLSALITILFYFATSILFWYAKFYWLCIKQIFVKNVEWHTLETMRYKK